ncbi:hypothetical protein TcasGA2_TC034993 [Tribolium castaneum]|uniref:Uncharacterized protein n=1 Tax=Tribolium castaneum TaxID=7070 RepID=A0A139W989_TRICA|nr:hypothetical protein TcasGA2_TC034993 [Tribolium castaneum]
MSYMPALSRPMSFCFFLCVCVCHRKICGNGTLKN